MKACEKQTTTTILAQVIKWDNIKYTRIKHLVA